MDPAGAQEMFFNFRCCVRTSQVSVPNPGTANIVSTPKGAGDGQSIRLMVQMKLDEICQIQ